MTEQMIKLTAKDGFILDAFQAKPANPIGGLVVLQEIFGVSDQLKSVARAFAELGFDTIVPAVYDRVSPSTVIPFAETERARATMLQLNVDQVMLDIAAAVKQADGGKGVSVLGFCWGGGIAMRAAGLLDLTSAVSYYGTALDKHTANGAKCPVLLHFGESDHLAPPAMAEQVRLKIPDATIYSYAAGHAFANDARTTYVPEAAAEAWQKTVAFLKKMHGA